MGDQLKALLKPLEHHGSMVSRGLRETLDWVPMMAETQVSQTETHSEISVHTEKSFQNLIKSTQKSDCIYYFPIDLEPNGTVRLFRKIAK